METSMSVLGGGIRTMEDTMFTSMAVGGYTVECPRSEALEIGLAVDLEVVRGRAQRGNPEIRPQV